MGYPGGYHYDKMFDGNTRTKWCAASSHTGYDNGWWVIFRTSKAFCPSSYTITTADDANIHPERNWKSWKIYGANFDSDSKALKDASEWVLLDDKQNIGRDKIPATPFTEVTFDMSGFNTEEFEYFMIYITKIGSADPDGGGEKQQMAEFAFVESDEETHEKVTYSALGGTKSGWGDAYAYPSLIDGNTKSKWCSADSHEGYDNGWWIVFKSSIPISPVYYELTTADDANSFSERNWKSWKIYGGNFDSDEHAKKDAQEWVLLDNKQDIGLDKIPAKSYTKVMFDLSENIIDSFEYFMIYITEVQGTDHVDGAIKQQMSEFTFGMTWNLADLCETKYNIYNKYEKAVGQKSLMDYYDSKLKELQSATSYLTYTLLVSEIEEMLPMVSASTEAYQAYVDKAEYGNQVLNGPYQLSESGKVTLSAYINEDIQPCDDFPNGSYLYVMKNHTLSTQKIQTETAFLEKLIWSATDPETADPDYVRNHDKYYAECAAFNYKVTARRSLTDQYQTLLTELKDCKDAYGIMVLYNELKSLQGFILASAEAYATYQETVEAVRNSFGEKSGETDSFFNLLHTYLTEDREPGGPFPNGSYSKIIQQLCLDTEQLAEETIRIQRLWKAVKDGTYYILDHTQQWTTLVGAEALFDRDSKTKWECTEISKKAPAYIIFMTPQAIQPAMYFLMPSSGSSDYNWRSWHIYGGNFDNNKIVTKESDGWVLIDNREKIEIDRLSPSDTCYFGFTEPSQTAYQYYMIEVSEAFESSTIQMSELWLGTEEDFRNIVNQKKTEMTLDSSVIAQQKLLDEHKAIKEQLDAISNMEELAPLIPRIYMLMKEIETSADAYSSYLESVSEAISYINANPEAHFSEQSNLIKYLCESEGPSNVFRHGTYPYILETHELEPGELNEESDFLLKMLTACLQKEYGAGTDITRLFDNLDFSNGFISWDNNGFSVEKITDCSLATIQTYNNGKIYRTVSGLQDGLYEVKMKGFFNDNQMMAHSYGALLFADNNVVPLTMMREEASYTDITYKEGKKFLATEKDVFVNSITTDVTNGCLTFGVDVTDVRTGCQNCVVIRDFQIIYHGKDDACELSLDCQKTRAKILIDYEVGTARELGDYPNCSQQILDEMKSVINGSMTGIEAVNRMSELFLMQFECKKAYYAYMQALIEMEQTVLKNENNIFTEEQIQEYILLNDSIWNNLIKANYTTEQALDQKDLKKSYAYKYIYEGSSIETIDNNFFHNGKAGNLFIYDLSGRMVGLTPCSALSLGLSKNPYPKGGGSGLQLKKGIYIVNGNKMMIK